MKRVESRLAWVLAAVMLATAASAEEAQVAVAANFAGPAKQLAERFAQSSGHKISLSVGSTGKFYAQIANGAPFDVLLSADDETPLRMEKEGMTVPGSRFTYAIGKLVLWSASPALVDDRGAVLRNPAIKRLAIANPKLAPYGAAARQTLEKLGLWSAWEARLVLGENIAQTLQFAATGNAELAFVALSQVQEPGKKPSGSHWLVPQGHYEPIRQDAALLKRGGGNSAARAFLDYLRSAAGRELVSAYGYDLP